MKTKKDMLRRITKFLLCCSLHFKGKKKDYLNIYILWNPYISVNTSLLVVQKSKKKLPRISYRTNSSQLTLCILGNFSWFYCRLLTFLRINFSKKFFQEHYQSVKLFRSRSGPTFRRSWSGSKLFAKVSSRRQKSPLARKELKVIFIIIKQYLWNFLLIHSYRYEEYAD